MKTVSLYRSTMFLTKNEFFPSVIYTLTLLYSISLKKMSTIVTVNFYTNSNVVCGTSVYNPNDIKSEVKDLLLKKAMTAIPADHTNMVNIYFDDNNELVKVVQLHNVAQYSIEQEQEQLALAQRRRERLAKLIA